jgi:hypothetical protein
MTRRTSSQKGPAVRIPDEVVSAYVAMWGATDEEQREALAEQALSEDAVLLYPSFETHGRADAVAAAERFQRDMPGIGIERRSGVEQHHGWVRVAWSIVLGDGSIAAEGESVGELAADGRLRRVIGFRDPLPVRQDQARREERDR